MGKLKLEMTLGDKKLDRAKMLFYACKYWQLATDMNVYSDGKA